MNHGPRIGLYYSVGPHFARARARLREMDPGARITVLIPAGYPVSDEIRMLAGDIVETELAHYSPRDLGACIRLVRQIRTARYARFAVMFDSPQLRILAALSGAPERVCIVASGRCVPLRSSLTRTVVNLALRNLWGRIAYAGIWLAIHLLPVKRRAGSNQE